jgi:hypothetical protein
MSGEIPPARRGTRAPGGGKSREIDGGLFAPATSCSSQRKTERLIKRLKFETGDSFRAFFFEF